MRVLAASVRGRNRTSQARAATIVRAQQQNPSRRRVALSTAWLAWSAHALVDARLASAAEAEAPAFPAPPRASIRPELRPDVSAYDASDPRLRDVSNMIQSALNAATVVEEERRWTQVIDKYGGAVGDPAAKWAADAVGRAYGNRGNSRTRQGKFALAIADYNQSMVLCPYSPDPVLNRGIAFEAISEYALALEDYGAVLRVDPSDPAAWNNVVSPGRPRAARSDPIAPFNHPFLPLFLPSF